MATIPPPTTSPVITTSAEVPKANVQTIPVSATAGHGNHALTFSQSRVPFGFYLRRLRGVWRQCDQDRPAGVERIIDRTAERRARRDVQSVDPQVHSLLAQRTGKSKSRLGVFT